MQKEQPFLLLHDCHAKYIYVHPKGRK